MQNCKGKGRGIHDIAFSCDSWDWIAKKKPDWFIQSGFWQGSLDSNQGITDPETVALPLGHTPIFFSTGRDDRIRTCGLLIPNQVRYQTALRPAVPWHWVYQKPGGLSSINFRKIIISTLNDTKVKLNRFPKWGIIVSDNSGVFRDFHYFQRFSLLKYTTKWLKILVKNNMFFLCIFRWKM